MTRNTHLLSRTTTALVLGLAVPVGAIARAQEPVPAEPQNPSTSTTEPAPTAPAKQDPLKTGPQADTRNVQVTVIITEKKDRPIIKKLSFVVAEGQLGRVRSGMQVAVPEGPGKSESGQFVPSTSYNYRPVGLNLDVKPVLVGTSRLLLTGNLSFSSVLPRAEERPSSFGEATTAINLVVDSGRSVTVTETTDGEIGREYTVQIQATILK